jgi:hypothetical protein
MTALTLTLTRSDPAKNLHRYYRLDVQPGAWRFIREWGPHRPTRRAEPHRPLPYFRPRLRPRSTGQRRRKERRGYA